MSYIGFAWITIFFYSISSLIGKYSTKHKITNPWLYTFVWSLAISAVSAIVALWFHAGWPSDWSSLWIAGALSAFTAVLYTLTVYALDVSILSPMYNFRTPISVILGSIWFHESFGVKQIVLMGVMMIAGMFVSVDEKLSIRSFFRKPIAFALFSIAMSAVYNASVKYAAAQNGFWDTVLWYNVINQLVLCVLIPLFWKDLKRSKHADYIHVALAGVLCAIGGITVIPALTGNLGITTAILALPAAMVLAIILSVFAPHLLEKHPAKVYAVRLVAATVMFAAALGLSS